MFLGKKLVTILSLVLALTIVFSGCSKSSLKDGSYTGTGTGYNGDIVISLIIEDGKIGLLTIEEENETEQYFALVDPMIASLISKKNTDGVDIVAGATGSSKGVMEAVKNALDKARE